MSIWNTSTYNTTIPNNNINSWTAAGGGLANTATSYTFTSPTNPLLSVAAGTSDLVLSQNASLSVEGKMLLNGQDLNERLKTIENVLMIPERDVKLEDKYPKLKVMYDAYIKELSKYRMWETLKDGSE